MLRSSDQAANKPRPGGKAKGTAARGVPGRRCWWGRATAGLRVSCLAPVLPHWRGAGRPRACGRGEAKRSEGDPSVAVAPAEPDPSLARATWTALSLPSARCTAWHGGGVPKASLRFLCGIMYGLNMSSDRPFAGPHFWGRDSMSLSARLHFRCHPSASTRCTKTCSKCGHAGQR